MPKPGRKPTSYNYARSGVSASRGAPQPKPYRQFRLGPVLAAFLVMLVAVTVLVVKLPSLQSRVQGASLAALRAKPAHIDQAQLASKINQVINGSSLEVGVSITDLTNNRHYDYGLGDTEYIAASTTKLLSAALFLHEVEKGQASLNEPLGESTARVEMQKMIVISDDDAWLDFNELLGHPALLQYAQSLGMNSYDPDNNTITSDDLALLLTRLYQNKLLNKQHTNLLLAYMAKADYPQYIGGAIPTGTKFYHKIGYLDDRIMDAAIIDNGHHPFVLVIFTKDPSGTGYDQTAGLQVFHGITSATLTAFAR